MLLHVYFAVIFLFTFFPSIFTKVGVIVTLLILYLLMYYMFAKLFSKKRKIFLATQIGCAPPYLFCGEIFCITYKNDVYGKEKCEKESSGGRIDNTFVYGKNC